ncbi:MAG: FIST C-terminal domain-containing protein [Defluviitaleaceae bacterium]|nr:FIST C-terminal domain-containing protein [Defluviitaleaceae bacterium]
MKSATAISYELDNIAAAAKELAAQIKGKFAFGKNTVAILHGQPEMEIGELSEAVSRELGCQVIGGTTAAGAMLTNEGYHELAVVLHVLSDDECLFAASISGSMANNPEQEIENTYQKALQNLKAQDADALPKMVICIASILQSIDSDSILEKVSNLCGSVPVFGYNAADDFEFQKQQVYLDGEVGGDKLAILLLSGNVKPIFQTAHLAGKQALEKRLVTKARGNVIYEIEGNPAYDYIKSFPFIDDETKTLFNYQFFVEMQNDEANDGIAVSRALHSYDKESGEVTCFANVPENSYIGLLYCDGNDVANTCESGIKELIDKINAADDDYEYSTVIIATCSLRNMFLTDMKQAEGDRVRNLFPPSLTVSGLYAFGEIAPTSVRDNNKAVNRLHNATLTVCAF